MNRQLKQQQAISTITYALACGDIIRAPCERCGRYAIAHHDDYALPLDVRWLCPRHHSLWHLAHVADKLGFRLKAPGQLEQVGYFSDTQIQQQPFPKQRK